MKKVIIDCWTIRSAMSSSKLIVNRLMINFGIPYCCASILQSGGKALHVATSQQVIVSAGVILLYHTELRCCWLLLYCGAPLLVNDLAKYLCYCVYTLICYYALVLMNFEYAYH